MVDPIQIFFVVIVTTLTVLLVIIGVEVFKILRQTQTTLKRVNGVLDDVETITSSVSGPVEKLSGLVQGLHQGANFVNFIQTLMEKKTRSQN